MEQQLDPSNCLGIKTFAETHGCEELRKAAEKYILKHFVDLVDSEEFLQLDNEDVVSLIKCDNLTVSNLYTKKGFLAPGVHGLIINDHPPLSGQ